MKKILLLSLLVFALASCDKTESYKERIIGSWIQSGSHIKPAIFKKGGLIEGAGILPATLKNWEIAKTDSCYILFDPQNPLDANDITWGYKIAFDGNDKMELTPINNKFGVHEIEEVEIYERVE